MFGVEHFELSRVDARFEAAAHEGLDQPVEHGVTTFFALGDHFMLALEPPSNLGRNLLVPKLPAQPVRDGSGDVRGATAVFPLDGDDLNHWKSTAESNVH